MAHYVYCLTFKDHSTYFGVRTSKGSIYSDIDYLSSSPLVKEKLNAGEICCREVLTSCETRELANELEEALITVWWKKPGVLNCSICGKAFGLTSTAELERRQKLSQTHKDALKAQRLMKFLARADSVVPYYGIIDLGGGRILFAHWS